ncbi:M23 family metallopeptidase [Treponema sp. OMZ 840]|uniref:peptidoglycan DD-metalloendopeptidase family protein n=1 Tax=Treponema sp. OMZ 840 TaxID=244313 RepID=UPI003D930331
MARTRTYKKLEKSLVHLIMVFFAGIFRKVIDFTVAVFKFCDRKLTIMIVPHSQSRVINFRTNIFSLGAGTLLFLGILISFFYFNRRNAGSAQEIARLQEENRKTLASLDELRDENNNLLQTAEQFQNTLSQALALIGINQTSITKNAGQNSDLSSLFNMQEIAHGSVKESADIRKLSNYLENAVQPIEQIGKMLQIQGAMLSDTPNVWPVKGGLGHFSMPFGQALHPITGQWYIHKGLDISTYRSGDPVISTANGQVVTVTYDASFGNYIIIQHKYGYYTRYAHLQSTRVKTGQFVSQGDVIGTIGNSGVSTGAHLHYEVHIGSEVVDPAKYVNIKLKN